MLRLFLTVAVFIAAAPALHAAECSVAVHKRWESAMQEMAQIDRLPWKEQADTSNIALQCRMMRALIEITAAAKDYFPACDPHFAGHAYAAVRHAEDALTKIDVPKCPKPQTASSGNKK